jgi:hypothetical protein
MSFELFTVNQSVTSLNGKLRSLRLPVKQQFPKLNRRVSHALVINGDAGSLPEMTTDVLDVRAGYAVENVRREARPVRVGLGQLVGRLLGCSHRAARP